MKILSVTDADNTDLVNALRALPDDPHPTDRYPTEVAGTIASRLTEFYPLGEAVRLTTDPAHVLHGVRLVALRDVLAAASVGLDGADEESTGLSAERLDAAHTLVALLTEAVSE